VSESPERLNGLPTVAGADLLPLTHRSGVVGDRDLDDPLAQTDGLCGHLGAELEPLALELHRPDQLPVHELVAGRFVGEADAIDQVRRPGDEDPSQVEGQGGVAAVLLVQPSRPVDHLESPGPRGREQFRDVGGVVFEIGVLGDHELPGRVEQGGSDRRPLAPIGVVPEDRDPIAVTLEDRRRAVGRRVIDDDDLRFRPDVGRQDAIEQRGDRALFVEHRNQDADLQRGLSLRTR
jgi:hypothetical protein